MNPRRHDGPNHADTPRRSLAPTEDRREPFELKPTSAWTLEDLDARIRALEAIRTEVQAKRRKLSAYTRRTVLGIVSGAIFVVLLKAGTSFAQTSACHQTLPAPLVTFCANTPAVASDINQNFQWIVDKIGSGPASIQTSEIQLRKRGTTSILSFEAQTNDPGSIIHHESNNTGELWLSSSDDWDAGSPDDRIVFGQYPTHARFQVNGAGDAVVSRDMTINRNLTVNGRITNLRVTGELMISRNGSPGQSDRNLGVTFSQGMCFLTEVSVQEVDSSGEYATCELVASNTNTWILRARLSPVARDTVVWCGARCLRWD